MLMNRSSLVTTTVSEIYPSAENTSVSGNVLGRMSSKLPASQVMSPALAFNKYTFAPSIGSCVVPFDPSTVPFNCAIAPKEIKAKAIAILFFIYDIHVRFDN